MKASLALALSLFTATAYSLPTAGPVPLEASPVTVADAEQDPREELKRNLDLVAAIPSDLSTVEGYDLDTNEFDPFAPEAEQQLNAFDEAYQSFFGEAGRVIEGFGTTITQPFRDLLQNIGGCYRSSCPVFAHVSRSKQTLTLYLNGQAVDEWLVSTGIPGRGTPYMDQNVSSRVYTRYSSKKFPGGDYNGLGNMPYAVFIRGGFAIHGTPRGNWRRLGQRASHGCIRLHPSHAHAFNQLVRQNGPRKVWILVN